jgi:catalase
MLWHFFLVHDDYGTRVGKAIGLDAAAVRRLKPLPGQVLTAEDETRLEKLGSNGDTLREAKPRRWTSSVPNHPAKAEDVLGGMRIDVRAPQETRA